MKTILVMLFILSAVSCTSRRPGWEKSETPKEMTAADLKMNEELAMKHWKERYNLENLKQSLAAFKELHAADPEDIEILTYLTRGHYLMADAHLEDMDEKKKVFEQAASYGEMGMALNPEFKSSVDEDENIERALKHITVKEVPVVYWTAAALGKWAKASGLSVALKYQSRIKAMIEKVEELQPDYFYGAVPRLWGAYYTVAPTFSEGNLTEGGKKFDESIKLAPNYLGTRVLKAEFYWTKKSDKMNFVKELEEVLTVKETVVEELIPENLLEKKKATNLLSKQDELF